MNHHIADRTLLDPSKTWKRPGALVADRTLSRAEKIELLRRWDYDARELEVASDEGMGGGERSLSAEIHEAMRALGYDPETRPSAHKQGAS